MSKKRIRIQLLLGFSKLIMRKKWIGSTKNLNGQLVLLMKRHCASDFAQEPGLLRASILILWLNVDDRKLFQIWNFHKNHMNFIQNATWNQQNTVERKLSLRDSIGWSIQLNKNDTWNYYYTKREQTLPMETFEQQIKLLQQKAHCFDDGILTWQTQHHGRFNTNFKHDFQNQTNNSTTK